MASASVNAVFTSTSAAFAAGNGINLQNLTGTLDLGGGTLTNTGSAAAFNVGSATDRSGGNATISYAGGIVSNGTGAAVSIQELTGGSVTLSGNLTDGLAGNGGHIVVANIDNGTAASVTFSGASKQISSGPVAGVSATANSNGTVTFSNGGLAIATTSGNGFTASGGTVSVAGAANSIVTGTGAAIDLNGVTIGAAGFRFDSVSATGAATGIALNNVASSGGSIALGTVNLQGIASRGVDISGTLGSALSFDALAIGLNSTSAVAFDLNGATINAPVTANDFDVTNAAAAATSIGVDLRGATGGQVVRLGDNTSAGNSSSISGVNTGVFLNSGTNLAFTYGDGESATDQLSTIGANVAIDASSAPVAGTYNFQDVNFTLSPGKGFGLGKVYFVDSDGFIGGGDGSGRDGANPMTLAAAEAALGVNDIIVLVNNGNAITAAGTNADNTLNLQAGTQVRGFGNGAINLALTVPSTIQLASNSIVIAAVGSGAATLTTSAGANVITLGASGNIIDGFILDGAPSGAGRGIKDNGVGASGTTVSNMTIRNFQTAGIEILPSASTTINGVTFSGNASDVILNASNTTLANVSSTGATGIAFDIRNATGTTTLTNVSVTGAGAGGISFGGASGPSGTITASNVDISGANALAITGGNAVISFDAASSIATASGTAVNIANRSGGSFTFAGSVVANGTANGISVSGATAANSVSFTGTVDLGTTTAMTGAAVSINNNGSASTVSFADLDIVTNGATGFIAGGSGTINVTTGTVSSTSAQAVALNGVAAGINFSSTSSTGGTNNIALTNVTGTVNLGSGALSGASGAAFLASGGSANVTYGGTITKTTGGNVVSVSGRTGGTMTLSGNLSATGGFANGILVNANTGGTIDFSGATKTLTTGANNAVSLTNNNGATINFTNGGLAINTSSGVGFNVTGGTVTVQGNNNTIASTTGTALNVANATIGSSNLTFRSISSNGAVNGIVLNNTGASGGLTVTGDGGGTNNGSGGTIQNSTGTGVLLDTTRSVNLAYMNITNSNGDGIGGTSVFGTASITNSTITTSFKNNMSVRNSDGTLSLTVTNSTFSNNSSRAQSDDGLLVEASGTATISATVTDSTFTANRGDHFQAAAANSGNLNVVFTGNTLTGGHATALGQGITINAAASYTGRVNYDIDNNTINGAIWSAINVNLGTSGSSALFNGFIRNNRIGTTGVRIPVRPTKTESSLKPMVTERIQLQ